MIVNTAYIYMGSSGGPVNPVIFNGNEINYIMNINQGTSIGNFAGYNFGEKEVLLDYGTKFKIDSVKKDAYGKVYIFLSQK